MLAIAVAVPFGTGVAARADWDDAPAQIPQQPQVQQQQQTSAASVPLSGTKEKWDGAPPGAYRPGESNTKWEWFKNENGTWNLKEVERTPPPMFTGGFGKVGSEAFAEKRPQMAAPALIPTQRATGADPMLDEPGKKGFFGGLKPSEYKIAPIEKYEAPSNDSPAWAKDKLDKTHKYVEGTEHHGEMDPGGFF